MEYKEISDLEKEVKKLSKEVFKNADKHKGNTDNKAFKIIEKIIYTINTKYKNIKEISDSGKQELENEVLQKLKDKILIKSKKEGWMSKEVEDLFIKGVSGTFPSFLDTVDEVNKNSTSPRHLELGMSQLCITYINVIHSNYSKSINHSFINSKIKGIGDVMDSIGDFWVNELDHHVLLDSICRMILLSIEVNKFEPEWGEDIVRDLFIDSIDKYSNFVPKIMLIEGIKILLKGDLMGKVSYSNIVSIQSKWLENLEL